jgi:hypothetical protein
MELRLENFDKPSNKKLKRIADFILYTSPAYLGLVMALDITDKSKMWINFGISFIIVTVKGLTKLTSEYETGNPTP